VRGGRAAAGPGRLLACGPEEPDGRVERGCRHVQRVAAGASVRGANAAHKRGHGAARCSPPGPVLTSGSNRAPGAETHFTAAVAHTAADRLHAHGRSTAATRGTTRVASRARIELVSTRLATSAPEFDRGHSRHDGSNRASGAGELDPTRDVRPADHHARSGGHQRGKGEAQARPMVTFLYPRL
jgi:hypothetical protein